MIIPKNLEIKVNPIGLFNADYSNVQNAIYHYHEGVDFSCPIGTELITDKKSIVISVIEGETGYGKCIVLQDYNDHRIFYLAAHLNKIYSFLKKMKIVQEGDSIGFSGNTGGKTGILPAHLHSGTYLVESKNIWDNKNTGFYYGKNYLVNQKFAVNPFNHAEKWKGG